MANPLLKTILVINPNSSKSMTTGLDVLISTIQFHPSIRVQTYTAASTSPASINNEEDARRSTDIVLRDLQPFFDSFDAFLVACYSVHPLVTELRQARPDVPVIGIFEASVMMALGLLPQGSERRLNGGVGKIEGFGIVSTGSYWEAVLSEGVREFLGVGEGTGIGRFKGVETTGLTAGELHTVAPEIVSTKMKDAVKRLVGGKDCSVICLGCAGMAGMDEIVAEALVEELGEKEAKKVYIVDGVKAGVTYLEALLRIMPSKK